jgi:hypothetical protein
MEKRPATVGTKEGLGAGIIGLGLLLGFLPSAAQKIADLDFVQSEPFGILTGAVFVMAVLTALAGLAVILANFEDAEE